MLPAPVTKPRRPGTLFIETRSIRTLNAQSSTPNVALIRLFTCALPASLSKYHVENPILEIILVGSTPDCVLTSSSERCSSGSCAKEANAGNRSKSVKKYFIINLVG